LPSPGSSPLPERDTSRNKPPSPATGKKKSDRSDRFPK
jgi:hypothetical protein